jgi:hypothetical protein
MMHKSDIALLYDTILSIPGMNEPVKVHLITSRKNLLLISSVIERGLNTSPEDPAAGSILDVASPELRQELMAISEELLRKGGLYEVHEKLKAL